MKVIEGLAHKYNVLAVREEYSGWSHIAERGDIYTSTVTWGEAQAIAAALNAARPGEDVWVVREIHTHHDVPQG